MRMGIGKERLLYADGNARQINIGILSYLISPSVTP